jgi:hypothetical protein
MFEMLAGVFVALAALALVLEPLVRPAAASASRGSASLLDEIDFTDPQESGSTKIQALMALKEIEFDRATGKLSDDDYASLKAKYSAEALTAIRAEDAVREDAVAVGDDPAEAAVRRARAEVTAVCPVCGPRPEAAAKFCSSCGRPFVTSGSGPGCSQCGTAIPPGAQFCGECGARQA